MYIERDKKRTIREPMRILNRYIIKEHIAPFFFALAVIMFILLMNFLVKYIGQIFGKGLPAWTIFKLITFNLGWMLALAVPMSTLVAVLMAFGRLSADNEIIILKSGGISIYRLILPSLYVGILITAVMIYFNDRILPETNHQAKILFRSIREKKPTLQLEEHIFYDIGFYTFEVSHIEKPLTDEWLDISRVLGPEYRGHQSTDRLRDILIFDRSDPRKDITILADEGYMVFSKERKALIFTLFHGEYHQFDNQKPDEYQRSLFDRQVVVIPAKEFIFEESHDTDRSDREMNVKMMKERVKHYEEQARVRQERVAETVHKNFAPLLTLWQRFPEDSLGRDSTAFTGLADAKMLTALRKSEHTAERSFQQMRLHKSYLKNQEHNVNRFLVEIYKKFSIPFASIVFVLVGAPLGIMARKGSMGVAISLSIGFFLLYWVFLIGGEDLADRQYLSPFVAMWAANILTGAGGLYLVWRAIRETSFIPWDRLQKFFKRGNG